MKQTTRLILGLVLISTSLMIGCQKKTDYIEPDSPQSITALNITGNVIPVHTGETFQVELTTLPSSSNPSVSPLFKYESGDDEIFTVSNSGLITANAIGDAILYVSSTNYENLKLRVLVRITDRVYDVTSVVLDEQFVNLTIAIGTTIDLSTKTSVLPANATNPKLEYSSSDITVVTVSELGVIKALANGSATIKISSTDQSNKYAECKIDVKESTYAPLDRSNWTITASHSIPDDAAISNSTESLLDGDTKTCLSLIKPGKSYAGISVPVTDAVFFIIDLKAESIFDYLEITHRSSNSYEYLRPYAYRIWGSNDGVNFEQIVEDAPGQPKLLNFKLQLPFKFTYRYVKVEYSNWDTKSGSTLQLSEINLGSKNF